MWKKLPLYFCLCVHVRQTPEFSYEKQRSINKKKLVNVLLARIHICIERHCNGIADNTTKERKVRTQAFDRQNKNTKNTTLVYFSHCDVYAFSLVLCTRQVLVLSFPIVILWEWRILKVLERKLLQRCSTHVWLLLLVHWLISSHSHSQKSTECCDLNVKWRVTCKKPSWENLSAHQHFFKAYNFLVHLRLMVFCSLFFFILVQFSSYSLILLNGQYHRFFVDWAILRPSDAYIHTLSAMLTMLFGFCFIIIVITLVLR